MTISNRLHIRVLCSKARSFMVLVGQGILSCIAISCKFDDISLVGISYWLVLVSATFLKKSITTSRFFSILTDLWRLLTHYSKILSTSFSQYAIPAAHCCGASHNFYGFYSKINPLIIFHWTEGRICKVKSMTIEAK